MKTTYTDKKAEYIEAINKKLESCDDISLLQLIYKVLCKSMNEEKKGGASNG